MSNTVFVDQTTIIVAAWLNDINNVVYNLLGNGTIVPATVAALRTNLGLGTMATQNASAVAITGGTASGLAITGSTYTGNITGNASGTAASITGVNPVANGGTGLSTTTAYSPVFTGTTATGNFQASLGPGTAGQVLVSAGAGALPAWTTGPFTAGATSPNQNHSLGAGYGFTHGLGAIPTLVQIFFVNVTAEGGYTAGQIMPYNVMGTYDGSTSRGFALKIDATTVDVRQSTNAFQAVNLTTGANFALTPANWQYFVRAWK